MRTDPNKPVFPLENPRLLEDGSMFKQHPGITLREYFAGLAMQGLGTWCPGYSNGLLAHPETLAQRALVAVQNADALIAELAKTEGGDA